jgi:hypothetical protein
MLTACYQARGFELPARNREKQIGNNVENRSSQQTVATKVSNKKETHYGWHRITGKQ